jgi:DNA polymerase III epsilon subunit-like protein
MKLPGSDPSPLLSVGCQRGLACVFLEQTRGVIIDLEATGDDDDDAG